MTSTLSNGYPIGRLIADSALPQLGEGPHGLHGNALASARISCNAQHQHST